METAKELFVHELTDMLDAEQKLIDALGTMAKDATRQELQKAFASHQEQTEKHAERIRQIFEQLDQAPEETECKGVKGLIEERESFKEEEEPADDILAVFDVGAAIKVESYEINAYRSLIGLAEELELPKAVKLLNQNLKDEQQALAKMEKFQQKIKPENLGMQDEEEEESDEEMYSEEEEFDELDREQDDQQDERSNGRGRKTVAKKGKTRKAA